MIEHLQLVFIELPKFPVQSSAEKKLRLLWLRFLRDIDEKTTHVAQELLDIPEIAQAVELAEESAYTPGELNLYESYWDQVSREKTLLSSKYAEGLVVGEAKGVEKGIKQGIEQGIEQGIKKIALTMLDNNEPLEKISQFTGLSQEELRALKR